MNKIEIILDRQAAASEQKKTTAFPRRRPQRFGRRRLPAGIRIYDVGYILDGVDWVNLPYLDHRASEDIDTLTEFNGQAVTLTHHDNLRSLAFTVPLAEWKDNYRQIDSAYTEDYGLTFGNPMAVTYRGQGYFLNGPRFIDGVFRPNNTPTNDNFVVGINARLGNVVNINPTVGTNPHITTEYDFAADAVAFVPSQDMDVFIMPTLNATVATATHDYTPYFLPGIVFRFYQDNLDQIHCLYPRELLHDESAPLYGEYLGLSQWDRDPYPSSGFNSDEDYERTWRWITYWRDGPGGHRAGRYESEIGDPGINEVSPLAVGDFFTEAMFPEPPTLPADPLTVATSFSHTPASPVSGALLLVIRNRNTYYYVWQP
jgi:hypothetical protein